MEKIILFKQKREVSLSFLFPTVTNKNLLIRFDEVATFFIVFRVVFLLRLACFFALHNSRRKYFLTFQMHLNTFFELISLLFFVSLQFLKAKLEKAKRKKSLCGNSSERNIFIICSNNSRNMPCNNLEHFGGNKFNLCA
jgi:hypothetical protein